MLSATSSCQGVGHNDILPRGRGSPPRLCGGAGGAHTARVWPLRAQRCWLFTGFPRSRLSFTSSTIMQGRRGAAAGRRNYWGHGMPVLGYTEVAAAVYAAGVAAPWAAGGATAAAVLLWLRGGRIRSRL